MGFVYFLFFVLLLLLFWLCFHWPVGCFTFSSNVNKFFFILANAVVAGCLWKVNNKNENIRWLLAMSRFHFGSFSEHVCVALLAYFYRELTKVCFLPTLFTFHIN